MTTLFTQIQKPHSMHVNINKQDIIISLLHVVVEHTTQHTSVCSYDKHNYAHIIRHTSASSSPALLK